MRSTRGDRRFWASTRGRVILLLRRGSRTVNELAAALGLTDNAVRTHLTALERDGLVHASGTRPGTRKPTVTYDLTPEAEQLFPKMYGPMLRHLLDVLAERLPAKKLGEVMRTVGHRVAANHRSDVTADDLHGRVAQAAGVLRSWGGMAEADEADGTPVIRCFDCPLAVVVAGHPEVCRLVETMLADLVHVRVRQRCQTEPVPRCYFEFGAPG
jgi:predicted ArsR family transcriptional regulator